MTISRLGSLGGLNEKQQEELLRLDTLNYVPKVTYSTRPCMVVYPENPRMKKRTYSHIEIALMIERNAAKIRELGLKPREAVALIAPNGMELAILFMTLQWAGAIGVPLDPSLGEDFMAEVIKDTGCKIIISPLIEASERKTNELWNKVERIAKKTEAISWHMYFDRNSGVGFETGGVRAAKHAAWHSGNKDLTLDPKEIAMRVVVPLKGKHLVLSLKQEDYCYAIKSFAKTYELKPSVMTVLSSPVYSLQGLLTVLAVMYSGGGMVIQAGGTFEPSKVWDNVKEDQVKWMSLTSEQVIELANVTIDSKVEVTKDMQLDFIRSCPGVLAKGQVEKLEKIFKCPVVESYGPPEASGFATANTEFEQKSSTLGKAVRGVNVGVFDLVTKKRKGPNERGHIAVMGENVIGTGYDNDADETENSRFWDENDLEHKSIEDAWMFTGDEGEFDDEGFLTVYLQEERKLAAGKIAAGALGAAAVGGAAAGIASAAGGEPEQASRGLPSMFEEEEQKKAAAAAAAEKKKQEDAEKKKKAEEEAKRKKEEEKKAKEEEKKAKEETASRALGAAAAGGELLALQKMVEEMSEKDKKMKEDFAAQMAERNAKEKAWREEYEKKIAAQNKEITSLLAASGISDAGFSGTLLERLDAIEKRQATIAESLKTGPAMSEEDTAKMSSLSDQKKGAESEARALRSATVAAAAAPVVMEVNMDEVEAASMAAASAAEEAKKNTDIVADLAVESSVYCTEAASAARRAADAAAAAAAASNAAAELATQVTKKPLPEKETIVREVLPKPKQDSAVVERTLTVNLEDVDQAVKMHPAVSDALAFGQLDERYGMDVYCAVIVRKGARVSEGWLRLHTQTVLPAAMVPKKFYMVDRLPQGRQELTDSENVYKDFCDPKKATRQVHQPTYKKGAAPPARPAASAPKPAAPPVAAPPKPAAPPVPAAPPAAAPPAPPAAAAPAPPPPAAPHPPAAAEAAAPPPPPPPPM